MPRFADEVRDASASAWAQLTDVRNQVGSEPSHEWGGGDTLPDGSVVMPHVTYSTPVIALQGALYGVGAVSPAVPWMDWAPNHFNDTMTRIDTANLDEVVAVLTTLVRSDRFSEGTLAAALDDGALLAAVDRLITLAAPTP